MMEVVTKGAVPPFERFYCSTGTRCLRSCGASSETVPRTHGQETFLRALRAYARLEHGRHLRAWVFTIATNVALDELRAKRPLPRDTVSQGMNGSGAGAAVELQRDAYRELEHLTGDLPPTERAAVVLRYGYDLAYTDIAAALGSSEDAARAAASAGVRRLPEGASHDSDT